MPFPDPVPGLVIRYNYLWSDEKNAGKDEGAKDRPCAIVAAVLADAGRLKQVVVLPVTHRQPAPATFAVKLPARVKRQLKLDSERSWIVVDEWNDFVWPGPDLRRVPGAAKSAIAYGMLPPGLLIEVQRVFRVALTARRARRVSRG